MPFGNCYHVSPLESDRGNFPRPSFTRHLNYTSDSHNINHGNCNLYIAQWKDLPAVD